MKKHERRSLMVAGCALGMALACAMLAPLGCSTTVCGNAEGSSPCEPPIGGTGGAGGAGATGGSAGTGTGGGAGTGGAAGTAGAGGSAGAGGGQPDASGPPCGGFASLRCPDPDTTFCDYEESAACGEGDHTGICTPRPTVCTRDCPGACGCDGKFFCNACEAHKAGIDDHPTGTCSDAGNLRRTP